MCVGILLVNFRWKPQTGHVVCSCNAEPSGAGIGEEAGLMGLGRARQEFQRKRGRGGAGGLGHD